MVVIPAVVADAHESGSHRRGPPIVVPPALADHARPVENDPGGGRYNCETGEEEFRLRIGRCAAEITKDVEHAALQSGHRMGQIVKIEIGSVVASQGDDRLTVEDVR